MMKGKLFILCLGLAIVGMLSTVMAAEEVRRLTKEELKTMLDDPEVVILDVRASRDWNRGERKIKGAIRENPTRFESWAHKYSKDKTLVLYCA
jgi:rhodanese-related sulfurtransferase